MINGERLSVIETNYLEVRHQAVRRLEVLHQVTFNALIVNIKRL